MSSVEGAPFSVFWSESKGRLQRLGGNIGGTSQQVHHMSAANTFTFWVMSCLYFGFMDDYYKWCLLDFFYLTDVELQNINMPFLFRGKFVN